MKYFLLFLIFLIFSCNNDKILIEIDTISNSKVGTLYIGKKSFDLSKENEFEIEENKNYKIRFKDKNDHFGYIYSAFLSYKEKTIVTINSNLSFRKVENLIPTIENFKCYLYDNYKFYIFRDSKIDPYSLIGHKNININKMNIKNNCINIAGDLLISDNKLFFIKNNTISYIDYNSNSDDTISYKKIDSNNFIIVKLNNDEVVITIIDLENEIVTNNKIFSIENLSLENSKFDIIYINNKIILWQKGKIYHIENNKIVLYNNFEKNGKLFNLNKKIYLLSDKLYKIEDKKYTSISNISLNGYQFFKLTESLLLLPNHLKNGSSYYVLKNDKLKEYKVNNSRINIKNFDNIKIDDYQYLFFNKDSFDEITKSNFFLFSDFYNREF